MAKVRNLDLLMNPENEGVIKPRTNRDNHIRMSRRNTPNLSRDKAGNKKYFYRLYKEINSSLEDKENRKSSYKKQVVDKSNKGLRFVYANSEKEAIAEIEKIHGEFARFDMGNNKMKRFNYNLYVEILSDNVGHTEHQLDDSQKHVYAFSREDAIRKIKSTYGDSIEFELSK